MVGWKKQLEEIAKTCSHPGKIMVCEKPTKVYIYCRKSSCHECSRSILHLEDGDGNKAGYYNVPVLAVYNKRLKIWDSKKS